MLHVASTKGDTNIHQFINVLTEATQTILPEKKNPAGKQTQHIIFETW